MECLVFWIVWWPRRWIIMLLVWCRYPRYRIYHGWPPRSFTSPTSRSCFAWTVIPTHFLTVFGASWHWSIAFISRHARSVSTMWTHSKDLTATIALITVQQVRDYIRTPERYPFTEVGVSILMWCDFPGCGMPLPMFWPSSSSSSSCMLKTMV